MANNDAITATRLHIQKAAIVPERTEGSSQAMRQVKLRVNPILRCNKLTEHTMTSHTYPTQSLSTDAGGTLTGGWGLGVRHLLAAVWRKLAASTRHSRHSLHMARRLREAAQARALADRCAHSDHRMAADLYCAADRHELHGH
jgi:hypothetical protein